MTDAATETMKTSVDATTEIAKKTSSELSSMKKEILRGYVQDQVKIEFETKNMPTVLEDFAELGGEDLSDLVAERVMEDFEKKIEQESKESNKDFLDKVRDNTVGGIGEHIQGAIWEKVSSMLETSLGGENYVTMMASLKEKAQAKYLELRTATEGEIIGLHDEMTPETSEEPGTTVSDVATGGAAAGGVAGGAVASSVAGSVENDQGAIEDLSNTEASVFFEQLSGDKPSRESFYPAYEGRRKLVDQGQVGNQRYLGIMDFSKDKESDRFTVMDMGSKEVSFNVPAGHGKGSGTGSYAEEFSNISGSNESSLGFVKTADELKRNSRETRQGLWLYGLETGINDQTDERGIALHPGSVNGSEGCITLPESSASILQSMKGGAVIFGYHPSSDYYANSDLVDDSHDLA